MADGRIVARKVTAYVDCGAYSRQTPYAMTKHAANAAGPYTIPNVSIDAYCVYTNRTPTTAMRGFGVTWVTFASRSRWIGLRSSWGSTSGRSASSTPTATATSSRTARSPRTRR